MNDFARNFGYIMIAVIVSVIIELVGFAIFDINFEETDSRVRNIMWFAGFMAAYLYWGVFRKYED